MKEERLWEAEGEPGLEEHDFLRQRRPIQCD